MSILKITPNPKFNQGAPKNKRNIDWERIEVDYRAGLLTLREIAGLHGISHVSVSNRAKRDGWTRDLSKRIDAKTKELVNESLINREMNADKRRALEENTVDASAKIISDVILGHRKTIKRARSLSESILHELEAVSDNRDLFKKLAELLSDTTESDTPTAHNQRLTALNRAIDMSARVDSLKKLSDTLKTLVALEREAFNLNNAPSTPDTPDEQPSTWAETMSLIKERIKK